MALPKICPLPDEYNRQAATCLLVCEQSLRCSCTPPLHTLNTMLVCRGGGVLMVFSMMGLVRCYVVPRMGVALARNGHNTSTSGRQGRQRLCSRRARSSGTRSSNAIIGPEVGHAEQGSEVDEWDTWEFGTWKVGMTNTVAVVARALGGRNRHDIGGASPFELAASDCLQLDRPVYRI